MRAKHRILGVLVLTATVFIIVVATIWSRLARPNVPIKVEAIRPAIPRAQEVALYELQLRDASWIEITGVDGEQIRQVLDNPMLPWGHDIPPGMDVDPLPVNIPIRMTTKQGKQFLYYLSWNGSLVESADHHLLEIPDMEQKTLEQVLYRITPTP